MNKVIKEQVLRHPDGAEAVIRLEATETGALHLHLTCSSCEEEEYIESTSPLEDSVKVMAWLSSHTHQDPKARA